MKGQTGELGVRGRSLLTAYLLGLRPPTIALEYDLDYSRRLTWKDYTKPIMFVDYGIVLIVAHMIFYQSSTGRNYWLAI